MVRIKDKDLQKYFQAVKLKATHFYVLAVFLFFVFGSVSQAQNKGSNLSLADSVYYSVLDSLLNGIPEPALKMYDSVSGDAAFLRSGWIHYWAAADAMPLRDSSALKFVMDRFEITVDYYENSGRLLGFNRKMKRRFSFFLQGWLEDPVSGKVVRSVSVKKIKDDFIDAGNLSEIEKSPFRFTKGTMKTKSVWMRYIQPGILIGAVSAIVYLFFNVRT